MTAELPLLHAADRALAKRVAKGDEDAFRDFFEGYYPKVFRFSARRMNDADAEEVTQQVFLAALKGLGQYRGEASLFTWLCQIARFEISARYRQAQRQPVTVAIEDDIELQADLESMFESPSQAPESMAMTEQLQSIVEVILDHLPADYGSILEWKYMEGYSVDEIARRLNTTVTAVQSKLARARDSFRSQYAAAGERLAQLGVTGVGGSGVGGSDVGGGSIENGNKHE